MIGNNLIQFAEEEPSLIFMLENQSNSHGNKQNHFQLFKFNQNNLAKIHFKDTQQTYYFYFFL